jgi:hypothetical protein
MNTLIICRPPSNTDRCKTSHFEVAKSFYVMDYAVQYYDSVGFCWPCPLHEYDLDPVVGRALLRPVIEEPLRVLQEEGLMRGAEAEEEKEEGGAPPGYLEYGNDDMGFDDDEEVAAAVEEVGGKRGRKKKPVSAAEAEEKKENKRAAERKRREQETKRIAELPTPDRNTARKERSDVEAARKRTQRKK